MLTRFTLSSNTKITGVRFWAAESTADAFSGSIVYAIYADNGNVPNLGSPTYVDFSTGVNLQRMITGRSLAGFSEVSYEFDLSMPFSATAGVTYWLGLHNGPIAHTSRDEFYWETTNNNGTIRGYNDSLPPVGDSWGYNSQEHAFRLTSDVPEPTSIAMLPIGLIMLILRKLKTSVWMMRPGCGPVSIASLRSGSPKYSPRPKEWPSGYAGKRFDSRSESPEVQNCRGPQLHSCGIAEFRIAGSDVHNRSSPHHPPLKALTFVKCSACSNRVKGPSLLALARFSHAQNLAPRREV
jgi:hypothetical protein